jgi:hypothetical protein
VARPRGAGATVACEWRRHKRSIGGLCVVFGLSADPIVALG